MKKINLLSLALLATAGTMFTSCGNDDEAVDPVVVQENDIPNGTSKISYSVHVISSSENAKVAGLAGATVTVSQFGSTSTKTTDASGIAVFEVRVGEFSVYATAPGHAAVNDIWTANSNGFFINNDNEQLELGADAIELPRIDAATTVKGIVTGNFDQNGVAGDAGSFVAGLTVRLVYDNNIQPNVYTTTTASDGSYTFTGVPEGPASIEVVDHVIPVIPATSPVTYTKFTGTQISTNIKAGVLNQRNTINVTQSFL